MRVGVGSGNPVKRRAVESVLSAGDGAFGEEATVESVPVDSGVSEQPRGHGETVAGAETRAANVLARGYDLGVGIEGGVAEFSPNQDGTAAAESAPKDDLYLVMWAAVDDGRTVGRGAGPSVRLPAEIERRIRAGEELGPIMDDVLGESGVAKRGGAAGALTNGRVDRETALATAVAGALGPFVTDLY